MQSIYTGGGREREQKRGKGKEADPALSVAITLTRGSILVVSMTELRLKALCTPVYNTALQSSCTDGQSIARP